jgi:hypothetical protein
MTEIILFSEDTLIEQAAQKIIAVENPKLTVSNVMGGAAFRIFKVALAKFAGRLRR